MFGALRGPTGRPTGLAAGIALLVLSGMLLWVRLGGVEVAGALLCGGAGIGLILRWVRLRREARYDLSRLWEEPFHPGPLDGPEPDLPDPGEAEPDAAPYCGWCDEVYPPGVRQCTHCGRSL